MRIELLTVPGCRNTPLAAQLLRRALDEIGLRNLSFETRVIGDDAEAQRVGFTGSPTFVINSHDPFAQPYEAVGLTCRLYPTAQGELAGLPDYDALRHALLAEAQLEHWQRTYTEHPRMYGEQPSTPAVYAAGVFKRAGATEVLELGAGHGRDALYFAEQGFRVHAMDFSATGLRQLKAAAHERGIGHRLRTTVHDVRDPLPLPSASVDGVYAHMLLCMALSTKAIQAIVGEVRRVLRPGGVFVYTVRTADDPHYGAGIRHGDDIFEHGGFAVHFFPRRLVDDLAADWTLNEVHSFEEGELPRRLWRVTQTLAG